MFSRRQIFAVAVAVAVVAIPAHADRPRATCASGTCYAPTYGYSVAAVAPTYVYSTTAATAPASGGLCQWLNSLRAARGLNAVVEDAVMVNEAAVNSSRGFSHNYRVHARRQNVGWGAIGAVCSGWLSSGAHASALFDPTITRVGFATVGSVTTFCAR